MLEACDAGLLNAEVFWPLVFRTERGWFDLFHKATKRRWDGTVKGAKVWLAGRDGTEQYVKKS